MSQRKRKYRRVHEIASFEESDGPDVVIRRIQSSTSESEKSLQIYDHSSSSSDLEDPFSSVTKVPTYGELSQNIRRTMLTSSAIRQRTKQTTNHSLTTQPVDSSAIGSTASSTFQARRLNVHGASSASCIKKRRVSERVKNPKPLHILSYRRAGEPQEASGSSCALRGDSCTEQTAGIPGNAAKLSSSSKPKLWCSLKQPVIDISSDSSSEEDSFKKKQKQTKVNSQYVSKLNNDDMKPTVSKSPYEIFCCSDEDTDDFEVIPLCNKRPVISANAAKIKQKTFPHKLPSAQVLPGVNNCTQDDSQSQSILNELDTSYDVKNLPLSTDTEDDSSWDPFDCFGGKRMVIRETDDETQDPTACSDVELIKNSNHDESSEKLFSKAGASRITDVVEESQCYSSTSESDDSDWLIKPSQMPTSRLRTGMNLKRPFSTFSRQTNAGVGESDHTNSQKDSTQSRPPIFSLQSDTLKGKHPEPRKPFVHSHIPIGQISHHKTSDSDVEQDHPGAEIFSYIRKLHDTSPQKPIGSLLQKGLKKVKRQHSKSPISEVNKKLKADYLNNSGPSIKLGPFSQEISDDENTLVYDDDVEDEKTDDDGTSVILLSPVNIDRLFNRNPTVPSKSLVRNFSKGSSELEETQVFGDASTDMNDTQSLTQPIARNDHGDAQGSVNISSKPTSSPLATSKASPDENVHGVLTPKNPLPPILKITERIEIGGRCSASTLQDQSHHSYVTEETIGDDEGTQVFDAMNSKPSLPPFIKKEKFDEADPPRVNFSFTQQNDVYVIESDEEEDACFAAMSQSFVEQEEEEAEKNNELDDSSDGIFIDPWDMDASALCEEKDPVKVVIKQEVDESELNESIYLTQKAVQEALNSWSGDEDYVDLADMPTHAGQGWFDGDDADDALLLSLNMDIAKSPAVMVDAKMKENSIKANKVADDAPQKYMNISIYSSDDELNTETFHPVIRDISPVPDEILSQILEESMEEDSQIVISDDDIGVDNSAVQRKADIARTKEAVPMVSSRVNNKTGDSFGQDCTAKQLTSVSMDHESCSSDPVVSTSASKPSDFASKSMTETPKRHRKHLEDFIATAQDKFSRTSFSFCKPNQEHSVSAIKDKASVTMDLGSVDTHATSKGPPPKDKQLVEGFTPVEFDASLNNRQLEEYLSAKFCDSLGDKPHTQAVCSRVKTIDLSGNDAELTLPTQIEKAVQGEDLTAVQNQKASSTSKGTELEVIEVGKVRMDDADEDTGTRTVSGDSSHHISRHRQDVAADASETDKSLAEVMPKNKSEAGSKVEKAAEMPIGNSMANVDREELSKSKDVAKPGTKSDGKTKTKESGRNSSRSDKDRHEYSKHTDAHKGHSTSGSKQKSKNVHRKTHSHTKSSREGAKTTKKHTHTSKSNTHEKGHSEATEPSKGSSTSTTKDRHRNRSGSADSKSETIHASTSKSGKTTSKSKDAHVSSSRADTKSASKNVHGTTVERKPDKHSSSRSTTPDRSSHRSSKSHRTSTTSTMTASASRAEVNQQGTLKGRAKKSSSLSKRSDEVIAPAPGWKNKLTERKKPAAVAKFQHRIRGSGRTTRYKKKVPFDDGLTTMTQSIETAKVDMYERVRKAKEERENAKSKKGSETAMVRDLFAYKSPPTNYVGPTKEAEKKKAEAEPSKKETKTDANKKSATSSRRSSSESKLSSSANKAQTGAIIAKAVGDITESLRSLSQNKDSGLPAPKPSLVGAISSSSNRPEPQVGSDPALMTSSAEPAAKKRRVNLPMAAKCSSTVPGCFRIVEQPSVQDPYELLKAMPQLTLTGSRVNPTADDFLTVILQWIPSWLQEYDDQEGHGGAKQQPPIMEKAVQHNPPLLSSDTLWPVPDTFETPMEYFQIMMAHILHELWAATYQEWQKNKQRSSYTSLVPVSRIDKRIVFQGLLSYGQRTPVGEGDLVIVKIQNGGQVFGYVERLQRNEPRRPDMMHPKLGDFQQVKRSRKMVMNITILMFHKIVPDGNFMRVEVVTSLVSVLRQIEALVAFPRNPLSKDLLQLKHKTFLPTDNPIPEKLETLYNASQARVIHAVTTLLLQPYLVPRVSLIQGPPGTGKSYTILRIIMNTVFRKTADGRTPCLMLCAPSNAAVDELVRRIILENDVIAKTPGGQQVRMVRIGSAASMSETSLPYSLDPLVRSAWEKRKLVERMQNMPMSIRKEMLDVHEQLPKLRTQLTALRETTAGPAQARQAQIKKLEQDITLLEKKESKFTNTSKRKEPNARETAQVRYEVLATAHVVCCTLNSAGNRIISEAITFGYTQARNSSYKGPTFSFTGVIIDEACQCVEVEALIPLQYCTTKLVLIGDPQQLPPTVISQEAESMKFSQSLFERLDNHFRLRGQPVTHMLDTQYRMHPEIARFPSLHVYDGLLKTFPAVEQRRAAFPHRNYLLFDLVYGREECRSMSVANPFEVQLIVTLVQHLVHSRVKKQTIGIITPYRQQKGLLLAQLKNCNLDTVTVGTVDGFQGQEKDVIIVSCVRARSGNGGIGFVADRRRMNVALTRAKYACYVVGHLDTLKVNEDWGALIQDARERNLIAKVTRQSEGEAVIQRHCAKVTNRTNCVSNEQTKKKQSNPNVDQSRQREQADQDREREQADQSRQCEQADQGREREQADQSRQCEQADQDTEREQADQSRQCEQADQGTEREQADQSRQREQANQGREREQADQSRQREQADQDREREQAGQSRQREQANQNQQQIGESGQRPQQLAQSNQGQQHEADRLRKQLNKNQQKLQQLDQIQQNQRQLEQNQQRLNQLNQNRQYQHSYNYQQPRPYYGQNQQQYYNRQNRYQER